MAKEMDQLTLDSIAAQKAGMSYGKWKALQYKPVVVPVAVEPEPEKVSKPTPPERRCPACGQIINGHGLKKYCSYDCYYEIAKVRQRGYYWRNKEGMI